MRTAAPVRKRRKDPSLVIWVLTILALVLILAVLMTAIILTGHGNSNPVTGKIQKEITMKAVENAVSSGTGTQVDIKELESQMTPEDAETFNGIVDKYADSSLISEAVDLYASNGGDISDVASQMRDRVDEGDMEALKELYRKYAE